MLRSGAVGCGLARCVRSRRSRLAAAGHVRAGSGAARRLSSGEFGFGLVWRFR